MARSAPGLEARGVRRRTSQMNDRLETHSVLDRTRLTGLLIHSPSTSRSAFIFIAPSRHVHLADSQRLQPGTGHTDFRAAFKALKKAGFKDYMALECGVRGPHTKALTECD